MLIKTDYHSIFNTDTGTLDKIDPNIKHVLNFWKTKAEFLYVNTSGSTGKPKGLQHSSAGYILYTMLTHKYVFDYQKFEDC